MSDRRFENAPQWLMWIMTFINRIGFPILVALYLGYMQIQALPKIVEALKSVDQTMQRVESAIRENTDVLKSWKYRDRR